VNDEKLLQLVHTPHDVKLLSLPQLAHLAEELREEIIQVVSKVGGHLASSLGAVELTLALHYVFDAPRDKIIWDVGHQAYAHKLLTGRREDFHTLRQYGGLSGFCKPEESEYDAFGAGHASTSIAAAVGMACARDLQGQQYKIVAVIGDGAMTGGLAYEALNNVGHLNKDILVVLNDNEMSISSNVGAIARIFNRLIMGNFYNIAKEDLEEFFRRLSHLGKWMIKFTHRMEESIKGLIVPGIFFEEMGFRYVGPIDGHDLERLIATFKKTKELRGPMLVHTLTKKGKGYAFAEQNPEQFHSSPKFDIATGETLTDGRTYTEVFGETLCELAERDQRIVAITAAMPSGTGLTAFAQRYPGRFFDVGIAEGCGVTMAAGMARQGLRPVVAIYSTFLQRAFDHIIHDVALQNLPVIFALDRGGVVGRDGPTHHGAFDLSYMRLIPNMVVMAPKDEAELRDMLLTAVEYDKGPISLRFPRGTGVGRDLSQPCHALPIGKAELLREGEQVMLLALGHPVQAALEAAQLLKDEGVHIGVANMRFAKPLDTEFLRKAAAKYQLLFSVEDNVVSGGIGSAINEALAQIGIRDRICVPIALPDRFIEHGTQKQLYAKYGLGASQIAQQVRISLGLTRTAEARARASKLAQ
jgi:1-deoxy-D-xylulose-5-phosphate synthase